MNNLNNNTKEDGNTIELYDVLMRKAQQPIQKYNYRTYRILLDGLSEGIYFVKVNGYTQKLIISKNIRAAETAKVIENIQRDINIALMNEILLICNRLKINFSEVIRLAKYIAKVRRLIYY